MPGCLRRRFSRPSTDFQFFSESLTVMSFTLQLTLVLAVGVLVSVREHQIHATQACLGVMQVAAASFALPPVALALRVQSSVEEVLRSDISVEGEDDLVYGRSDATALGADGMILVSISRSVGHSVRVLHGAQDARERRSFHRTCSRLGRHAGRLCQNYYKKTVVTTFFVTLDGRGRSGALQDTIIVRIRPALTVSNHEIFENLNWTTRFRSTSTTQKIINTNFSWSRQKALALPVASNSRPSLSPPCASAMTKPMVDDPSSLGRVPQSSTSPWCRSRTFSQAVSRSLHAVLY